MVGCMDGWQLVKNEGRKDECMNGKKEEEGRNHGRKEGRMAGCTSGWMDG